MSLLVHSAPVIDIRVFLLLHITILPLLRVSVFNICSLMTWHLVQCTTIGVSFLQVLDFSTLHQLLSSPPNKDTPSDLGRYSTLRLGNKLLLYIEKSSTCLDIWYLQLRDTCNNSNIEITQHFQNNVLRIISSKSLFTKNKEIEIIARALSEWRNQLYSANYQKRLKHQSTCLVLNLYESEVWYNSVLKWHILTDMSLKSEAIPYLSDT